MPKRFATAVLVLCSCSVPCRSAAPPAMTEQAAHTVAATFAGADRFRSSDLIDARLFSERLLDPNSRLAGELRSLGGPALLATAKRALAAGTVGDGGLCAAIDDMVRHGDLSHCLDGTSLGWSPASRDRWRQLPMAYLNRAVIDTFGGTAVLPVGDVRSLGRRASAWRSVWQYASEWWLIDVDCSTLEVASAMRRIPRAPQAGNLATVEHERHAEAWLAERGINLADWERRVPERAPTGSANIGVSLEWVRRSPDGVRLLSVVQVKTGPSGHVERYYSINRDVCISTTPTLTAAEAHKRALAAFGPGGRVASSTDLRVWCDQSGHQVLLWEWTVVDVSGAKRIVLLNGHTGEVVARLAPLGSPRSPSVGEGDATGELLSRIDAVEIRANTNTPGKNAEGPFDANVVCLGRLTRASPVVRQLLKQAALARRQPWPGSPTAFWIVLKDTENRAEVFCRYFPGCRYLQMECLVDASSTVASGTWPPMGSRSIARGVSLPVSLHNALLAAVEDGPARSALMRYTQCASINLIEVLCILVVPGIPAFAVLAMRRRNRQGTYC